MVNLSDLSTAGGSSDSSSSGETKVRLGYGGTGTEAHYVMATNQTSSTGHGFTFFDRDFGSVSWGSNAYTDPSYQSTSHFQDFRSGTYTHYQIFFSTYSASQSNIGSSSNQFLNSFQNSQWGGWNGPARMYSNGTIAMRPTSNTTESISEMKSVFNSDHTNKSIAYQFRQGQIRAVQYDGFGATQKSFRYPNTKDWDVPGSNSLMQGAASYNKSLKKLFIVRSISSNDATYNCYSGVDFDAHPSPTEAMTASGVTVVTGLMSLSSFSGNSESIYRIVPVLCDDGTVWVSAFVPSAGLDLWGRVAVPTSDGNFSPTYIGRNGTTTSYGYDQGHQFGRTMLESRDRKGVLIACPYYYYGSGVKAYALPRSGSDTNTGYASVSNTNSSNGVQPLPFRDDGFCFYYAGNGYSSNYNGSYLFNFITRSANDQNGGYINSQSSNLVYLPYYGRPNTTNYPGLCAVTDYDLLSYNHGAR